jgi:hypothetical protein
MPNEYDGALALPEFDQAHRVGGAERFGRWSGPPIICRRSSTCLLGRTNGILVWQREITARLESCGREQFYLGLR